MGRERSRGVEVLAGEDEAGDDGEIIEADEQDAEPIRTLPTPSMPSASEVEEHRVDHIPYRCWCRECIEGFGREDQHHPSVGERWMPIIGLDSVFV